MALLVACAPEQEPPPEVPPQAAAAVPAAAPAAVVPLAQRDTLRDQSFFTYTVEPTQTDLRLYNLDAQGRPHSFASVAQRAQAEGRQVALLMNGGMFQPDRRAQGLLILQGRQVQPLDTQTTGYGNFYLQPNGVFALDTARRAYVVPTQRFDSLAEATAIAYATQSGPMLVVDSLVNPLFSDPSPNRHIRNGVGVTAEGRLVLAISEQEVTFFELAELFRQHGCREALYLDGFVSRLYLPALGVGSLAEGARLGPLIAIFQDPTH